MKTPSMNNIVWVDAQTWPKICKPHDTVLTVMLIDPFVRVWLPIVAKLGFSPNAITCFRFVVAIAGAVAFWNGLHVLGSLSFILWYVLDCVDGKIARWTGAASVFGDWLDRMTDRLGISLMLLGLSLSMIEDGSYYQLLIISVFVGLWLLRVMNSDRLSGIMKSIEAAPANVKKNEELRIRRGLADILPKYLQWTRRHRFNTWLFHDVEWLTIAIVIGPLTNSVFACIVIASICMALQELLHTTIFWWRRYPLIKAATAPIG